MSADEILMRRALDLAEATVGLASPNPQVGCVLARDGAVLAEGAHVYEALDHAEIVALKQAATKGIDAAGATACVTLEPCSHHGRTGPCADALIAARIARCVVATQDPNPAVAGRGIAKMRAAGIEVVVGVLQAEARALNNAFAHFIRTGLPFVTLKAALSVDGRLAPPPAQRKAIAPHWLTGEAARADVQRLRHASDAILTGIGTVLADDPTLTDRTGLPRRRELLRVVLDRNLRMPVNAAALASGGVLIFHGEAASEEKASRLRDAGAETDSLAIHDGGLDLNTLLAALGRRGLLSLLLEAGSALNGAFLRQNLVDRAVLYFSETELGADALPFAMGAPGPYLLQQRLKQQTRVAFAHGTGEDVRIAGLLHDPWNALG